MLALSYGYRKSFPIDIGNEKEPIRRTHMANIGLTPQKFKTFCYGVAFLAEQYYKDPANMEAYKKWKKERDKERKHERDSKGAAV